MVTVETGDESGRLRVVFFNQAWRERQLQPGLQVALFGKAEAYKGRLTMTNPVVDLIGDRTGRIVAVYPQSEKSGLTTWEIAGWVETALARCRARGIADPVPEGVLRRLQLESRDRALRSIHAPDSMDAQRIARRRLVFDELLRVQLALVLRKRALEQEAVGIRHVLDGKLVTRFHERLPFPLTGAQARVIEQIERDLARAQPMHRLLQGDVGAGKTVVAVSALLVAVQGGHQGALDGTHRSARRATRARCPCAARRSRGARPGDAHGRSATARRAADEPHQCRRAPADRGRARRRKRRPSHRHARIDPGGRRAAITRCRRDRRAAPVRRRTARDVAGERDATARCPMCSS